MLKQIMGLLALATATTVLSDTITVKNLKIEQVENGNKIKVSWRIDDAGFLKYYSVALTRGESSDTPASQRTIVEPYDLNFWQQSPDCSMTDTPPQRGKRYYYWLHVSDSLSFQMSYLMDDYGSIKGAPCVGPLVGWIGELADQPKAPTELNASYDTDPYISLSWNSGENASAYNVYRGTSADTTLMSKIAQNFSGLSGADRGAVPGCEYFYAVKSVNDGSESVEFSPVAKGRALLAAPEGVSATAIREYEAAEVKWDPVGHAESYSVYAGFSADFSEATKVAEGITQCCFTNELRGTYAIKDHYYWVKSHNAYCGSTESQSAQLNLLAPAAVDVEVSSANVAGGSIGLAWSFPDGRKLPRDLTFTVVRKVNDDSSSSEVLSEDVSGLSYVDTTWGMVKGTATISYWVVPNADDWPLSNECITRRRFGLFVGIDRFENDWCRRLSRCVEDAQNLRGLSRDYGRFNHTVILSNGDAKKNDILSWLQTFSEMQPGDIFLFSLSTHGGTTESGTGAICCYDNGQYIYSSELGNAFLQFPGGVGVVAIIDTCHAESMSAISSRMLLSASAGEMTKCGKSFAETFVDGVIEYMNNASQGSRPALRLLSDSATSGVKLTVNEIGWITAAASDETAWDGWFTSDCICKAGWRYGGADYDDDDLVTFKDLADFSKGWQKRYLLIFPTGKTPGTRNEDVLAAITAGRVPEHKMYVRLLRPERMVARAASLGTNILSWDAVDGAEEYYVMRHQEGTSVTSCVATVQGELSWCDGGAEALVPGARYNYYIVARNPMDISEQSASVTSVVLENPELVSFVQRQFDPGRGVDPCAGTPSALNADGSVNYSTVNMDHDGDGFTTFQEYVAGTDPLMADSFFRATVSCLDGMPSIHWIPDLNTNAAIRDYMILGKTNLLDEAWVRQGNMGCRFFKVTVALPKGE